MKLETIIIGVTIIVGAIIMRPPTPNESLNKHLINENKALHEIIIDRERQINEIKIDILKSHENEKEIIRHVDSATVQQLDSIWARFFDNLD